MSLVMKMSFAPRLNPNGKPPLDHEEAGTLGVLALLVLAVSLGATGCNSEGGSASLGSGRSISSGVSDSQEAPATDPVSDLRSDALDAEEWKFLDLINAYRAQNGVAPLEVSVTLQAASRWLSEDMAQAGYFSHTDSAGRSPFDRMRDFGYDSSATMGENIAAGHESAADTFQQWKSSPGHNQNMLSPSYRAIGISRHGMKGSAYGWYWTTGFGGVVDEAVR